jgi:hypothetical protein
LGRATLLAVHCKWRRLSVFEFSDTTGEIGFAALCYMDYFWPKGFNENIKLIRDKTLMQGHTCCNHRYVWQA